MSRRTQGPTGTGRKQADRHEGEDVFLAGSSMSVHEINRLPRRANPVPNITRPLRQMGDKSVSDYRGK